MCTFNKLPSAVRKDEMIRCTIMYPPQNCGKHYFTMKKEKDTCFISYVFKYATDDLLTTIYIYIQYTTQYNSIKYIVVKYQLYLYDLKKKDEKQSHGLIFQTSETRII